jgi:hypothetical protein
VSDLSVPTTRDERRSARRAWAAYPYALRRDVVRAAKRGQRHPDEAAVGAAVAYAAAVLRPTGRQWWQSQRGAGWAWPLVLVAAVLLAGAAVWSMTLGPPRGPDWAALAFAVLIGLWAVFVIDLRRECRRLLTAPLPTAGPPH